ncbi:MAG: tyrosine--tRNA ligase [Nanoarchaeota archaeon]|nr:tyrosine--tRNA ligase [Nanoarchaeota archaeon]
MGEIMDTEERLKLIEEVGEELITKEEILELLSKKQHFIAYDGFEPSGRIHIAQGLVRAINVNKMVKAGATFKMLVADWHGWANNKMDGDLDKIQTVGKYFIEVWKASGMDLKHVEFVWASELLNNREYWKTVMQIARKATLKRVLRTTQIMGRSESDSLQASQIIYPCMQAADIYHLRADICQLGMDQRKVNVMAREIGPEIGLYKPIIVSHHMLMGLAQPASDSLDPVEKSISMKMSKSKPDTSVFMTDSEADIVRKLGKAYCPEKQSKDNPVLEYYRYIIFERYDTIEIRRPDKFGGNIGIGSYAELESKYVNGEIHPLDLKQTASRYINELLIPVRDHFEKDQKAKELKAIVESYAVTR